MYVDTWECGDWRADSEGGAAAAQVLPAADYDDLLEALKANCVKLNLQPTPVFIEKVLQLYEMILVRHGLMIVGFSYGAKTSAWRALAGALTDLKEAGKLAETAERTRRALPRAPLPHLSSRLCSSACALATVGRRASGTGWGPTVGGPGRRAGRW